MSEIELKACPFCGQVPSGVHDYFDGRGEFRYVVNCTNDDCPTDYMIVGEDSIEESAALKWNTRAPQWQPIETAPKDGTEILAWDGHGQATIHWSNGRWSLVYAGWRAEDGDFGGAVSWQPLPAPPEVGE